MKTTAPRVYIEPIKQTDGTVFYAVQIEEIGERPHTLNSFDNKAIATEYAKQVKIILNLKK